MKKYLLCSLLLIGQPALAGFQGEYCGPDDESYLLKSNSRLSKQSKAGSVQLSFVRSDADGEETNVVLLEGQDFKMQILDIARESQNEEKLKCADGHESKLSSGASDIAFVFEFQDESALSKSMRKKIKKGKFKTVLSCQWTAEEKPCAN